MSLSIPVVFAKWGEGTVRIEWQFYPMVLELGRRGHFFRPLLEYETPRHLMRRRQSERTVCRITFDYPKTVNAPPRELAIGSVVRDTRDAPNRVLARCHTFSKALKDLPIRLRQLLSRLYQKEVRQHYWFALTTDGMLANLPDLGNDNPIPLPEQYSTTNSEEKSCPKDEPKCDKQPEAAHTEHPQELPLFANLRE